MNRKFRVFNKKFGAYHDFEDLVIDMNGKNDIHDDESFHDFKNRVLSAICKALNSPKRKGNFPPDKGDNE